MKKTVKNSFATNQENVSKTHDLDTSFHHMLKQSPIEREKNNMQKEQWASIVAAKFKLPLKYTIHTYTRCNSTCCERTITNFEKNLNYLKS